MAGVSRSHHLIRPKKCFLEVVMIKGRESLDGGVLLEVDPYHLASRKQVVYIYLMTSDENYLALECHWIQKMCMSAMTARPVVPSKTVVL